MHFVILLQQPLRQVATVLAGDARDNGPFHVHLPRIRGSQQTMLLSQVTRRYKASLWNVTAIVSQDAPEIDAACSIRGLKTLARAGESGRERTSNENALPNAFGHLPQDSLRDRDCEGGESAFQAVPPAYRGSHCNLSERQR